MYSMECMGWHGLCCGCTAVFGVFKGCIVYGMGCMVRCVHVCMGCTMGTVAHTLCLPSSSLLPRNDNVGVGVCNINLQYTIQIVFCVLLFVFVALCALSRPE